LILGDANIELPPGVIDELQNRDLQADDYELLKSLDSSESIRLLSTTLSSIDAIPTMKYGHYFLNHHGVGETVCKCCMKLFNRSDIVRILQCAHVFHKACIDRWLINHRDICPLDGAPAISAAQKQKKGKLLPALPIQPTISKPQIRDELTSSIVSKGLFQKTLSVPNISGPAISLDAGVFEQSIRRTKSYSGRKIAKPVLPRLEPLDTKFEFQIQGKELSIQPNFRIK
jgi:hypothetical protein